MLKTLVVKINNMSSKFSSPFFKKSPLLGAYSSGADGMVTVSDLPHYEKLQQDLVGGTLAAVGGKANKDKNDKFAEWLGGEGKGFDRASDEYRQKYNEIFGAQAPPKPE